ncbi:NnrU family protein [Phaeovulum veldkampii]|nr:NnrU family protein [Phaeovulum veldkampii]TDQ61452.1 putative membrane protein [Phaeovulum veldkampii DSM 11550]
MSPMFLLILGILLWMFAHLFKRLFPSLRARLGNVWKIFSAVLLLASLVAMVIGYRGADVVPVYDTNPAMYHANNALMILAVYLFAVGGTKSVLVGVIRHPMLWGTVIWAVSHLMVNGDLASALLFGSMLMWALLEMLLINRAGRWENRVKGSFKGDLKALGGTVVVYGIAVGVHIWLGYNPFVMAPA